MEFWVTILSKNPFSRDKYANGALNKGQIFVTGVYYIEMEKSCSKMLKMAKVRVTGLGCSGQKISGHDTDYSGDNLSKLLLTLINLIKLIS